MKEGTELDFIENDFAKLSGQEKAEALDEIMGPSCPGFEVKGHVFYLLGPFHDRDELLEGLKENRMLKPVHDKWKKFRSRCFGHSF